MTKYFNPPRVRTLAVLLVMVCIVIVLGAAPVSLWAEEAKGSSGTVASGSPSNGEKFFTGITRFQNGGPPCLACHNISGLPFPGGGTVGPDLTGIASKFGTGMDATLATLPFPTMKPIFGKRPLAAAERQDLEAYFRTESGPAGPNRAFKIALPALGGLILLIALIWAAWKGRLTTIRKALLRSGGSGS